MRCLNSGQMNAVPVKNTIPQACILCSHIVNGITKWIVRLKIIHITWFIFALLSRIHSFLSGANVASTSQVRATIVLVLPIVGN
jgi:hypothetical protein